MTDVHSMSIEEILADLESMRPTVTSPDSESRPDRIRPCPHPKVHPSFVETAGTSQEDEVVEQGSFVGSVTTSGGIKGSLSLTSSALTAEQSSHHDAGTRMNPSATIARGPESASSDVRDISLEERGESTPEGRLTTTSLPTSKPSKGDSRVTPMDSAIDSESQGSGGVTSKMSCGCKISDAPSVDVLSSSALEQGQNAMPTSITVTTPGSYADGSVLPVTVDLEPSMTTLTSSVPHSNISTGQESSYPTGMVFAGGSLVGMPPSRPPKEWFSNPDLLELQRFVTITAEGRVFGHLAGWETCHIGYPDMCIQAPREESFDYFHHGQVETTDGELVATGPIAIQGGHAEKGLPALSARAHYDDVAAGAIDVAVGPDDHGIWFSGALRPDVTEAQVRRIRASGVSGDWRQIDGKLRLIGICSVNTPGFPKVRLVASGELYEVVELVAAGGRPLPATDDCGCDKGPNVAGAAKAIDETLTRLAIKSLEDDLPAT